MSRGCPGLVFLQPRVAVKLLRGNGQPMTKALSPVRNGIVKLQDGQPKCNSRDLAAMFGKRHDHVLSDVDAILKAAPTAAPNFGECSYQAERGGRSYRAFNITKDGFVLLAMGFTGKEALRFKLAYIARFNEMEAALRKSSIA